MLEGHQLEVAGKGEIGRSPEVLLGGRLCLRLATQLSVGDREPSVRHGDERAASAQAGEQAAVEAALARHGDQAEAAKALGISLATLKRRLKKFRAAGWRDPS